MADFAEIPDTTLDCRRTENLCATALNGSSTIADRQDMSVSGVSSSLTNDSSVLSLLGQSTYSSASSLLSSISSSTDTVTLDLSNYEKAVSCGDTSGKSSALNQLKQDLSSEQTSLLSTLEGSGSTGSDAGNSLLSSLYGSSSSGSGSILDTIA